MRHKNGMRVTKMAKLNAENRTSAVLAAIKHNLVELA